MKITEEIEKLLPENWKENWEPIEPEKIEKNMYIAYVAKPRKYESGKEDKGGFKKGGLITFTPDMEKQAVKGNEDKVFGFRQYRVKWSVNQNNILLFLKTKKNTEEVLAKGKSKSKETKEERRINKIDQDAEKLKEQLAEVKEITKAKKRKVDIPVEVPEIEEKIKKPRGRPPKVPKSQTQPEQ